MKRAAFASALLLLPCFVAGLWLFAPSAAAHDMPLSYIDLRLADAGMDASVEAPAIDFAHDLPAVTPDVLLTAAGLEKHKQELTALLATRLVIEADGRTLTPELRAAEPVTDQKDVRLRLRYLWKEPPHDLRVRCRLFPYDPRHKTFLDIYRDDKLERQAIFTRDVADLMHALGRRQGTLSVIRQFVAQGVHHIFIGPDHILFIVGLLLLGGTLKHLIKIVTAFTVAHSVTLVLATLGIVNPPARPVESIIALSIVFVGAHALLARPGEGTAVDPPRRRDPRLLFAFCFGLIHGFGFASVLRELELPWYALGWSLFSFNVGVEIGQACIVLAVAPLLAVLDRRSPFMARRIVTASSVMVIFAGVFWFVQRVVS